MKIALQLGDRQVDDDGAAVRTVTVHVDLLERREKAADLVRRERIAGANGAVAGERRRQAVGAVWPNWLAGERIGGVAECTLEIGFHQLRGHGADLEGVRTELLEAEAKLRQRRSAFEQSGALGRAKLNHDRRQQRLGRQIGPGTARQDLFVENPLVGGVLVDEKDASRTLGDDIGVLDLADRS